MKKSNNRLRFCFYMLFFEIFVCKCENKKINSLICELITLEI